MRDAEALVRGIVGGTVKKKNGSFKIDPAPKITGIIDEIGRVFSGLKVNIKAKESGGGVLNIQYDTEKDLERLLKSVRPDP